MKIIFNAREMYIADDELSYEKIRDLLNRSEQTVITVTYQANKREIIGSLTAGQSVRLREGMVVNASVTDNA